MGMLLCGAGSYGNLIEVDFFFGSRRKKGADFQNLGFSMTMYQTRNIGHPLMNLVRLKGFPILQQLHLEERLLRNSSDNWCIINDGTDNPTIVMGVSGYIPQHVVVL